MAKELYPCSLHGLLLVRSIHHRDFRIHHTYVFGPGHLEPTSSSPKVSAPTPSASPSTMPFAGFSPLIAGPSTNIQPKPPVPEMFQVLVERIRHCRDGATRAVLGADLVQIDKDIYKKANASTFAAYIDAAMVAGVVTLGKNASGEGVISLRSPWPFAG